MKFLSRLIGAFRRPDRDDKAALLNFPIWDESTAVDIGAQVHSSALIEAAAAIEVVDAQPGATVRTGQYLIFRSGEHVATCDTEAECDAIMATLGQSHN